MKEYYLLNLVVQPGLIGKGDEVTRYVWSFEFARKGVKDLSLFCA